MRLLCLGTAVLLLFILPVSHAAKKLPKPPPAPIRERNGVRLTGGSGSKGRLEVSSTASWLTDGTPGAVTWRPLCDDDSLGDSLPQIACEMLGYKYGRRYYSPDVNYREADPNATRMDAPLGYMYCSKKGSHRRLASSHAADNEEAAGMSAAAALDLDQGSSSSRVRGGRALLAPLRGSVNTPAKSPYSCSFRLGDCGYPGPMAGVECSNSLLPPAPPPPPVPPTPPPAPPPKSDSIRLVGGANTDSRVEPNLCSSPEDPLCAFFGRVEVQVAAPDNSSALVWAPLCALGDQLSGYSFGKLVCNQVANWPDDNTRVYWLVHATLAESPFTIPQGTVTEEGAFNPAQYGTWATVVGGDLDNALRVQELDVQVSTSQCDSGAMFAVRCDTLVAG
ncbi:hypothetical protein Agub_g12990 [Astrephomene gubernaculifera]|uniref:SRCR domain-containing protein n=1 Tax=Astrephomene gubernaculifera TaxID=47775 RepID=A0AAD3HRR9_9CHLO|nr:hypothetical protein Agub_g12990 [Astrephomene gubernaculifera]